MDRAAALREELTLAEKAAMVTGDTELWPTFVQTAAGGNLDVWPGGAVERLGIEGVRFTDGPRGVTAGSATCFPVAIARGATFDAELEERIGEAVGREARALGANLVGAPCVNLIRHPAWGRAQESYGEEPEHVGELGAAFVRGVQRHAMACVKHFALNSIEEARYLVDVRASDATLDAVFLPQFERIVRAGVASVMTAYNAVNGEWCGQNRRLITEILKERWGFEGFVVSDWLFGIRDGVKAINAGLDLEMPHPIFLAGLEQAVERGDVPIERLDDAVLRLLRQQLRFADVPAPGPEVVACAEHRALAREAAVRSIVLLRNEPVGGEPVLPLRAQSLRRVAVVGTLAAVPNLGDRGSSHVEPPEVVTPLAGLQAALPHAEVVHDDGSDPARAAAAAAAADVAILVVGLTHEDEGEGIGTAFPPPGFEDLMPPVPDELQAEVDEALRTIGSGAAALGAGGDRDRLTLRPGDEDLILAVAAANPRTIVAVMCGSAVLMERWRHAVPGLLILWYPGMEGGHALADVLLGEERPTGRLPLAFPRSAEHLPPFDAHATSIEYGPLHGQALLDDLGVAAAYPRGFGLGYT